MKKLRGSNINQPDLAWKIFSTRWAKQVHFIDWDRFSTLAAKFKGGRYLDAACFNSPYPFYLTQEFNNAEVYAVDHCAQLVNELQKRFPKVNYACGKVEVLPYEDGFFDYVVAGEIIEHTERPEEIVKELFRVLKRGGTLALSTPEDEDGKNGSVSNEHLWSFTEEDIRLLLSTQGTNVETKILGGRVPIIIGYATKI